MDPVSDMFIRIKNAGKAGHETVQIPYSKLKHDIAKTLERFGFVGKVDKKGKRIKKFLEFPLVYQEESPLVRNVKLISKPSRRIYSSYRVFHRVRHRGIVIVSTPRGVMSSDEAKKMRVGGEMIAEIW